MFPSSLPLLPLVLDDVPWALRQMLAQEGIATVNRDRRGQGQFLLFDSRLGPCRRPRSGQSVIDIDRLRHGFERDPFEHWSDCRTWRQQWSLGELAPSEEIGRSDKRGLRRLVMARLRGLVERRGGVWVRVSAYPYPYRSVFNLRIDHDQYDAADFTRLQAVLGEHQGSATHFVNGSAYEPHEDALRQLAGLDVGSHGYRHHTYRTYEENARNIARGIHVLENAGLRPVGFTAPHGRFNRGLLDAMSRLEIAYSSEFAAGYDELPFFHRGSSVLQVPVHPVCLGIFLEAAEVSERLGTADAVDMATEHFLSTIRAKRARGEPIFLYGHPTGRLGRYPRLLMRVLEEVSGHDDLWRVTMSGWAAWWRARSRVRLTVSRDGDGLVVELAKRPARYRLAIEYDRDQEVARLPAEDRRLRFSPEALSYEAAGEHSLPRPVRIDQAHGLRGRVRRLIDWERETPIEEIAPSNWRNVAKRTLRTLWN